MGEVQRRRGVLVSRRTGVTPEQVRECERVHGEVRKLVEGPFGGATGFGAFLARLPLASRVQILSIQVHLCTKITAKTVPEPCGLIAAEYLGKALFKSKTLIDARGGPDVTVTPSMVREEGLARAAELMDPEVFTQRAIYDAVMRRDVQNYLEMVESVASEQESAKEGPKIAQTPSHLENMMHRDYSYLFGETKVGKC